MNSKQPTLTELTNRALVARQGDSLDISGDVEPHEVLSGIRVDAHAAWADAQFALKILGVTVALKSTPADWPAFVDWNSGRLGIPLSAGQFPQRLRDIGGLFAPQIDDASKFAPTGFASLKNWIGQTQKSSDLGSTLLANGLARELGDSGTSNRGTSPVEVNEQAASLWLAGKREAALNLWQSLPESPVASFNLGMALLMLGRAKFALPHLQAAVANLPETSGWHHLAALYLSVAQVRA